MPPGAMKRVVEFGRLDEFLRPERIRGQQARMTRKGDGMSISTIGVDISKDVIDAHRINNNDAVQFTNSTRGWKAFIRWARQEHFERVIFEPTGPYHRGFEKALVNAGIPASKVNPLHARRFAEATGRLAKTDKIDARMLGEMGAVVELRCIGPENEGVDLLKELHSARRGLKADLNKQGNRKASLTIKRLRALCDQRIRQIEKQISVVEEEISKLVASDPVLREKIAILMSVPGLSVISSTAVLSEMPELGHLESKTAASLGGLAPINRESGLWRGRAMIRGGRRHLRTALYMPALVAIRYLPAFKAKFTEMKRLGKPGKVAVVAIMRKLLVLANALIRDNRKWSPSAPNMALVGR